MKFLFTFFVLTVTVSLSNAQLGPYYSPDGIAIQGYDPVAYFTDNAAVLGSQELSVLWQGKTWYFRNQFNRDAFQKNPEKYAPQFGGYCAYGASENHKAPTEPTAFSVVNGKLYLNYSLKVKELWMKDTAGHIRKAEINWVTLRNTND